MPLIPILILTLFYVAAMAASAVVLRRTIRRSVPKDLPRVSVVIAARDEEESIAACLHSMTGLDYPGGKLQVVVVDDHSSDRTAEIVSDFAGRFPTISLLAAGEPAGQLRGKVNALVSGIEATNGEIIMMTDADCTVRPEWVRQTVSYLAEPEIDLVAGFIRVEHQNWFEAIQAIDWLFLLSAASAGTRLSFPVTAVGNNLSVRRSAYDSVGGYRALPFNVTEDLALFQAVTGRPGRRAVIPIDISTSVATTPCPDWPALFHQRKRWFVGGKRMGLSRVIALGVASMFHLVILAGWAFLSPVAWGGLIAAKLMIDYAVISPSMAELGIRGVRRYWIPFQFYLSAYVILLPLTAIFSPSVVWKGRGFRSDLPQ